MNLVTYVNFAGRCAEAFRYYEQHLGGKVEMMMTHAQSPDQSQLGPEWKDAVLHARMTLGGTSLMGADIPNAEPMRSAYLTLEVDSDAEAERTYAALSAGGQRRVGLLRFGIALDLQRQIRAPHRLGIGDVSAHQ